MFPAVDRAMDEYTVLAGFSIGSNRPLQCRGTIRQGESYTITQDFLVYGKFSPGAEYSAPLALVGQDGLD
jgi:hypothetical protein